MTATTNDLPDLEAEARRLIDHLDALTTVHKGLGAAATRVEHAAQALDAAHDALRTTDRQVGMLNGTASAALAAIDRLQPDQMRAGMDSGFASARADLETLQQRLTADLDGVVRDVAEQGAAEAERHEVVVKSIADAALRILDAIEQVQRRIEATDAAACQMLTEVRAEHAALSEALTAVQQQHHALATRAQSIAVTIEAAKTAAERTQTSAANIETLSNERLPALARELQALRTQIDETAKAAARRQALIFVATILLFALLIGFAFRLFGVR